MTLSRCSAVGRLCSMRSGTFCFKSPTKLPGFFFGTHFWNLEQIRRGISDKSGVFYVKTYVMRVLCSCFGLDGRNMGGVCLMRSDFFFLQIKQSHTLSNSLLCTHIYSQTYIHTNIHTQIYTLCVHEYIHVTQTYIHTNIHTQIYILCVHGYIHVTQT